MIQKKVCLLGSFSVGKTSLVRQFISTMFDEKYLTTVGVKVDKKELTINDTDMMLMIWDLAGEDDYSTIQKSYLRGASGCIMVVDGTRGRSLDTALSIRDSVIDTLGNIPFVMALNKADIQDQWQVTESQIRQLDESMSPMRTSAKTGMNVEVLFSTLAEKML